MKVNGESGVQWGGEARKGAGAEKDGRWLESCGWGVEEEVTVYKYFVTDADGHESEDTATIATVLDITYDVDKLCNIQEKWICMDIKLRLILKKRGHHYRRMNILILNLN